MACIEVVRTIVIIASSSFKLQGLTGNSRLQVTIPGTSPPLPYVSSAPYLFSASYYLVVPNQRFRPRSFNSRPHTHMEKA